jgi:hypothetical protein
VPHKRNESNLFDQMLKYKNTLLMKNSKNSLEVKFDAFMHNSADLDIYENL